MMRNNTLVLAEWYDAYIPPRHHMAVMTYGNVLIGVKKGYAIAIHPLDSELFKDERPPVTPKRSQGGATSKRAS